MKRLVSIFILIVFVLLFPMSVSAEDENSYNADEVAESIGEDLSELQEGVPDSVNDILTENGITPSDTDAMTKVAPLDIIGFIWGEIKGRALYPLKIFAAVLAVILLSALVDALEDTIASRKLTRIYGIICVMVAVTVIATPVSETIKTAAAALSDGGVFMAGYIPVFAGITASSGQITGAASYSIIVIFASNLAVSIASNIMIPVLSVCMVASST
jgi:stage III sporulation protein AE